MNQLVGLKTMYTKVNVALIILFTSMCIILSAQSPYRLGAGIGAHISGNMHGGIYDVYGNIYNGKNAFAVGSCIQKRSGKLCGVSTKFSHIVTGRDQISNSAFNDDMGDRVQLYFLSYLQYLHNTPLSYNADRREAQNNPANSTGEYAQSKIKLNTIDAGAGFGLNVKLTRKIVMGAYICVGTYYHTNYTSGMYGDKMAPVLTVGTSIGFNTL